MSKGRRQDETPTSRATRAAAGSSSASAPAQQQASQPASPPLESVPSSSAAASDTGARDKQPRRSRRASRRPAIIEGAVRVFAEKGYFNATVAEIARAAGVADGTIYLYFKSKDELLLSVFDEKMALLCGAAKEAVETATSCADALRRVAALHLEAVERNPAVASVLIVEMRQSSPFVNKAEKPRLSEYLGIISDVVSRGQESGEFRSDVHPAAFKRALFGALDEIALGWLVARRKFDLDRTARDIAELFVRGLLTTPQGDQQAGASASSKDASSQSEEPAGSDDDGTGARTPAIQKLQQADADHSQSSAPDSPESEQPD